MILGLPVIISGEGIRVWSSGHISKNTEITKDGPYSLSRNPLYVGNFLLGVGFVVMAAIIWMVPVFLLLFAGLYHHTIRNEEDYLAKKFPEDWADYMESVPRYIPVLNWPEYSSGKFSWSLVKKHRETNNWVAITIIIGLLVLKGLLIGSI